jgi:hypothetical protein
MGERRERQTVKETRKDTDNDTDNDTRKEARKMLSEFCHNHVISRRLIITVSMTDARRIFK